MAVRLPRAKHSEDRSVNYAVVTLVRDREWIFAKWCDAINAQTVKPQFVLVAADEADALTDWYKSAIERIKDVPVITAPTKPTEMGWRRGVTPALESSHSMARMRNSAVKEAFTAFSGVLGEPIEAVLSVDSDVILAADGAERLGLIKRDLVCAPVRNGDEAYDVFFHYSNSRMTWTWLIEDSIARDNETVRVHSGGACVLIRAGAWNSGLRYEAHEACENVGLGECAKKMKLDYVCNLSVRSSHWMSPSQVHQSHSTGPLASTQEFDRATPSNTPGPSGELLDD